MRKISLGIVALMILLFSSFSVLAEGFPFTITFPEWYEKIEHHHYYTDSFLINDVPSSVSIVLEMRDNKQSEEEVYSSEAVELVEKEVESKINEKYQAYEISRIRDAVDSTYTTGYKFIRVEYRFKDAGHEYGGIEYRFYSEEQCFVITFTASNPLYLASNEDEHLLETLRFDKSFEAFTVEKTKEQELLGIDDFEYEEIEEEADSQKNDAMISKFVTYVFLPAIVISGLFLIGRGIYWSFDHGKWARGSKPDINAKVIDVDTKQVMYLKNGAQYKTTVTFEDGYIFITHKTNRKDKLFKYEISVDSELMKTILQKANEWHMKAVQKYRG